jgi:glycosyltransferase involved in cell wall biosynthesis
MTLGIDLRCLPIDGSAGGGIAHAARAITFAILKQATSPIVVYLPKGARFDLPDDYQPLAFQIQGTDREALIAGITKHPCQLLFVPSGAIPANLPVPAIPWVHDCDIFQHPEWFPQSWWQRQLTTRLFLQGLKHAPQIFAVSEYTRQSIEKLLPITKGRITVTREGGDDELATIPAEQFTERKREALYHLAARGIDRRFVLMLGTVEPRKNIPLICKLWPDVAAAVPGVDLVVAGQDGWKTKPIRDALYECSSKLASLDSRGVRLKDFTEDERRDLLLAADLVLVPSFSEGFSLVALEAIQSGTPVLASKRGALPEVVGKGDWLLDPDDANAWHRRIIEALSDGDHRNTALLQSHRRSMFSWEKSAAVILKGLGI